jgi:hypothetical protein
MVQEIAVKFFTKTTYMVILEGILGNVYTEIIRNYKTKHSPIINARVKARSSVDRF